MARRPIRREADELEERVVHINRVAKVVKGGRRFGLTALVVVGDHNGHIGIGMGKSQEVPIAVNKAVSEAKKNMFTVALTPEKTVPHEIIGEYGAGRVLIKPATPGTGVIAGSAARAIMELAGVTDVFAKSLGTDNVMNVVKATAEGLKQIQTPTQVGQRRNMSVGKIFGTSVKKDKAAKGAGKAGAKAGAKGTAKDAAKGAAKDAVAPKGAKPAAKAADKAAKAADKKSPKVKEADK